VDVSNGEIEPSRSRSARVFESARVNNVPLKTILTIIGLVVAVYFLGQLLYRLRSIFLLLLVGGFVALLLNPLVLRLQKWGVRRRGVAVALVGILTLLVFAGFAVAFGYPLANSLTHLANALPNYVSQAEKGRGWIGHLITRYHVEKWFSQNSSKLVTLANGLSKPALALGKGAVSVLFAMVTLYAFILLLLLEGPLIREGVLKITPSRHVERVQRLGTEISKASLGYILGGLLMSLMVGVVVLVTLLTLGVPFAILFALWVVLVDFLPQIGGALAGIPTVLFAFFHSVSAGIITAVVFLAFTLIQNHVLSPIIMSKTVNINPLAVFMAIIFGAEIGSWVGGLFGGFVGVLLAIPVAAAIHVTVKELWQGTHAPPASTQ
jgi:predicted PurR-regulated permease PerM